MNQICATPNAMQEFYQISHLEYYGKHEAISSLREANH